LPVDNTMTFIKDIIRELEYLAPPAYQESYDNAGLLVGEADIPATGVLLTLDVTEDVVREAVDKQCNLIVAHHPIIFKGLKRLNGKNYVERTVISAIKNDIAVYAIHTNLDHVHTGVNAQICAMLGLQNVQILASKAHLLYKLTFFSPVADTQTILNALFKAGAGAIGNYKNCSFRMNGTGTFLPGDNALPAIGKPGTLEEVTEHRVEVMFPSHLEKKMLSTLRAAHPYEEVAYYITALENQNQEVGAGAIGELSEALEPVDFLQLVKTKMKLEIIKHTAPPGDLIRRVAVCGGAGSFLLPDAIHSGADAFVTADYKYHEFFDAEGRTMICDIGHYESEVYTKNLLYNYLSGKFRNFALCLSDVNTNPVRYFV
jgi:dinuclear metal center YbgI/SA1388 family protein